MKKYVLRYIDKYIIKHSIFKNIQNNILLMIMKLKIKQVLKSQGDDMYYFRIFKSMVTQGVFEEGREYTLTITDEDDE